MYCPVFRKQLELFSLLDIAHERNVHTGSGICTLSEKTNSRGPRSHEMKVGPVLGRCGCGS